MFRSILIVSLLVSTGCATTPRKAEVKVTDPASVQRLRAIQPSNLNNAAIVIYRNTAFGSMFGPVAFSGTVFLDESPVGDVSDDSYAVIEVKPGRHSVRISGSAGGLQMQTSSVITVAAGKVQFLQLDSQQGMTSYNMKLLTIGAPDFEAIAADCKEAFTLNVGSEAASPVKTTTVTNEL